MPRYSTILFTVLFLFCILSCKKLIDPAFVSSDYPEDIENIMTNKCATSGCHNNQSYVNAGNLNLTNWTNLFQGASNGAVAVPYNTNQSPLLQFVNTYADLGITLKPTMPLNQEALSREEVLIFKKWIENGCPNKSGNVPFAENASTRNKIYVTNQGCDLVNVIDASTQLTMRYITVGHDSSIETPHNIQTSSDGKFWYVCFVTGSYFQKYDATSDHLVSELFVGPGAWNVIKLSSDGKLAYLSDLSSNGRLLVINVETMKLQSSLSGAGVITNPHGVASTISNDTIYITSQSGNMIYRYIPSVFSLEKISLEKDKAPVTTPQLLDPHEIVFNTEGDKYFITCQASDEVRVMDKKMDTLLRVIPVGRFPLEMAISQAKNELYITCQEDPNIIYPFFKGSVYVINMSTFEIKNIIREKFFQPHGITVDENKQLLYVISRNADPSGPAPHHLSNCGGRNGFYTVIDITTGKTLHANFEISADPYSAAFRMAK